MPLGAADGLYAARRPRAQDHVGVDNASHFIMLDQPGSFRRRPGRIPRQPEAIAAGSAGLEIAYCGAMADDVAPAPLNGAALIKDEVQRLPDRRASTA